MNQEECKEIKQALDLFLNESLERILMSNPTDIGKISRSRIRPLLMKGRLVFQAEEQAGKQAFHRNLDRDEAADYVTGLLGGSFRQAEIASGLGKALILVSRKGKVTVKVKQNPRRPGFCLPETRLPGNRNALFCCPTTGRSIISWRREFLFPFWWIWAS